MSYLIFDIETSITPLHGRKGSPFHPNNFVVCAGFQHHTQKDPWCKFYRRDSQHKFVEDFIAAIADKPRYVIGHNIKFDLLHVLRYRNGLEAWMDYVAGGGLVWDTQLVQYQLEGQDIASHMTSLNELLGYYKLPPKIEGMEEYWKNGVSTEFIPVNEVREYVIGRMEGDIWRDGDIGCTKKVFMCQVPRVRAYNMGRTIRLNQGSLVCSTEMERNGLLIDVERGKELTEELKGDLAQARDHLNEFLPKNLPFKFSWGNRFHLSAVLFGGNVKYDGYEWYKPGGGFTRKEPAIGQGVYIKGADPMTATPKGRKCKPYYHFDQITEPDEEWKSAKEGVYSVAAEVIEALTKVTNIPFLKTLGTVTKMAKDLSTYFFSSDKIGMPTGMLSLVGDDGIIHHSIGHTSTKTGRLSGYAPNLMNLPKGDKSKVKELFISRYPGGSLVQGDWSSLEVYCLAILAKAKQLVADLRAKMDPHCIKLSLVEGRPYEEVLRLAKGYVNELGEFVEALQEWIDKRSAAKEFTFLDQYGGGVKAIARLTGLSEDQVRALKDAQDQRYPENKLFLKSLARQIKDNAITSNQILSHPSNPALRYSVLIGKVQTPDGKRYSFRSQPSPSWLLKKGTKTAFSPTELSNYPFQGLGAEILKTAMWLLVREFYRLKNFNHRALLVNVVHDAVYVDSHPDVLEEVTILLQAGMEAASDFMGYWFIWELPLPVPVELSSGPTMAKAERIQIPDYQAKVAAKRSELRERYMGGFSPAYLKEDHVSN